MPPSFDKLPNAEFSGRPRITPSEQTRAPGSRKLALAAFAAMTASFAGEQGASAHGHGGHHHGHHHEHTTIEQTAPSPAVSQVETVGRPDSDQERTSTERQLTASLNRMERIPGQVYVNIGRVISQHGDRQFAIDLARLRNVQDFAQRIHTTPHSSYDFQNVPWETSDDIAGTRSPDSMTMSSAMDAHRALEASRPNTSERRVQLDYAVNFLFDQDQIPAQEASRLLGSELYADQSADFMRLAEEAPNLRIDLSGAFNETELQLFSRYMEHLQADGFWSSQARDYDEVQANSHLAQERVTHNSISLQYASRLFRFITEHRGTAPLLTNLRWVDHPDGIEPFGSNYMITNPSATVIRDTHSGEAVDPLYMSSDFGVKLARALSRAAYDVDVARQNGTSLSRAISVSHTTHPQWDLAASAE